MYVVPWDNLIYFSWKYTGFEAFDEQVQYFKQCTAYMGCYEQCLVRLHRDLLLAKHLSLLPRRQRQKCYGLCPREVDMVEV